MTFQTVYGTLPKKPFTVRLLRLHPTEPSPTNQDIVLSLETYPLAQCPPFEALSYTWGPPSNEHNITVGGTVMQCRDNLYRFLRRIRLRHKSRLVWVDAFSIRQDDLDEKADQVANIASVFSAAETVLAWLGEHANGSETIFERRSRPPSIGDRFRQMRIWYHDKLGFKSEADWVAWGSTAYISHAEINDRKQKWSDFLLRPYWNRFWILQELVVAQKIIVCCGHDQLAWEKLIITWRDRRGWGLCIDGVTDEREDEPPRRTTNAPDSSSDRSTALNSWNAQLQRVHRLQEMRTHWQEFQQDQEQYLNTPADKIRPPVFSFDSLLNDFQQAECFDRRDRLYAIRALLPKQRDGALMISPDYKIKIPELYLEACKQLLFAFKPEQQASPADASALRRRPDTSTVGGDVFCHLLRHLGIDRQKTELCIVLDSCLADGEARLSERMTREVVEAVANCVYQRKLTSRGAWALDGPRPLALTIPFDQVQHWAMDMRRKIDKESQVNANGTVYLEGENDPSPFAEDARRRLRAIDEYDRRMYPNYAP